MLPKSLTKYFSTCFDSDLVNIDDRIDVMRAAERVGASISSLETPNGIHEAIDAVEGLLRNLDLEAVLELERISNSSWSEEERYVEYLRDALQVVVERAKEKLADYEKTGAWVRPATS